MTSPVHPAWMRHARCQGHPDPDWFFPDAPGEDTTSETAHRRTSRARHRHEIRQFCAACPVQQECLQYALQHPELTEYGYWGGLSRKEREALQGQRSTVTGDDLRMSPREQLEHAVYTQNTYTRAAKVLGITRDELLRRAEQYGLRALWLRPWEEWEVQVAQAATGALADVARQLRRPLQSIQAQRQATKRAARKREARAQERARRARERQAWAQQVKEAEKRMTFDQRVRSVAYRTKTQQVAARELGLTYAEFRDYLDKTGLRDHWRRPWEPAEIELIQSTDRPHPDIARELDRPLWSVRLIRRRDKMRAYNQEWRKRAKEKTSTQEGISSAT